MSRGEIFGQIESERAYQDGKWGHAFDDKNTINDWSVYIGRYVSRANADKLAPDGQRTALIKVAALAVAAIETFDRNLGFAPRHYDNG